MKPGTVSRQSRADEVIHFGGSEKLVKNSGLSAPVPIEAGTDNRFAEPEPARMLRAFDVILETIQRTE